MDKIHCQEVRASLSAYLDGELSQERNILISKHLGECHACRNLSLELQLLRETLRYISKKIPKEKPPISEYVLRRLPTREFGILTDPVMRKGLLAAAIVIIGFAVGFNMEMESGRRSAGCLFATQIDGDAQLFQAKQWGPVEPNAKISVPAFFRTKPGADMTLQSDNSFFFLKEGGFLEVLRFSPDVELTLEKGTLLVLALPSLSARKIRVNTLEAQAEVNGTVFKIRSDDSSTKVEVLEGRVSLRDPVTGRLFVTLKELSRATVFSKTQHVFINEELSEHEIEALKEDFTEAGLLEKNKEQGVKQGAVIFWREIR
ncbi:MAG: zf-HC2 domain-containing protein [Candidatus Omnitrophica bacterium]|nr:zf-HC2 domain-containing protein [Candidatus Omnitrophota bacterium]